MRFLGELRDEITVEREPAEPGRGPHRRDRRNPSVLTMEGEQVVEVQVGDAVAVGQHERSARQPGLQPVDAAAGHRVGAGIHQVEFPGLAVRAVAIDRPCPGVERHAARERGVIEEIPLDHIAPVAERDEELGEPIVRVVLQDVPEQWPAAHLHHRLRLDFRFFGQTGAESSGEDDDLHSVCILTRMRIRHRAWRGCLARTRRPAG